MDREDAFWGLHEVLESREFRCFDGELPFVVGRGIDGGNVIYDLVRAPHLLLGGVIGSGKSMFIHSIILSLLCRNSPDQVKFLMIDQGMCDFIRYEGIPHLVSPAAMDWDESLAALKWAVAELEKRIRDFRTTGVTDLKSFNSLAAHSPSEEGGTQFTPYPRLVIIINELAALRLRDSREVGSAISYLIHRGQATGIHLIMSTQVPSVGITWEIHNTIRCRAAFEISNKEESELLLGVAGAEKLVGNGDMLFFPPEYQKPIRVQGAYVSSEEVKAYCAVDT